MRALGRPMSYRPIARIVWEVAELHLDEAEFLAEAFEQDLDAYHSTIHEVAEGTEERLLANVDGLVILGPPGVERLIEPALQDGPPWRAQAAAMARLGAEHDDGFAALWPAMVAAEGELAEAQFRGLALAEGVADARIVEQLGRHGDAADRLLLGVCARRGVDPGPELARLLAHEDPAVTTAALEAARFADPKISQRIADAALTAAEPPRVQAALRLVAQQSLPTALGRARELAEGPLGRSAMELLAVVGSAEDTRRLFSAFEDPARQRDALWALGFAGTREAAERALSLLGDEALGGLAAEAFLAITGLDPVLERCRGGRPPEKDGLPPLEEDDLDADLVPPAEALLPRLDPAATTRWWKKAQGGFPQGQRFLAGHAVSNATFLAAFDPSSTRRRRVLALELAVRSKGRWLLAPRASTARQARQLAAFRGA